jgi:hypothetical protein
MKIKLTLTEHQASLLQEALEAYARAGAGQIKDIIYKSLDFSCEYTPENHIKISEIDNIKFETLYFLGGVKIKINVLSYSAW